MPPLQYSIWSVPMHTTKENKRFSVASSGQKGNAGTDVGSSDFPLSRFRNVEYPEFTKFREYRPAVLWISYGNRVRGDPGSYFASSVVRFKLNYVLWSP